MYNHSNSVLSKLELSANCLKLSLYLAILLLAGCAIKAPATKLRLPETPIAFKENTGWEIVNPAETQERGEWWKVFSDATLSELCERAGSNNTSVQLAVARLDQARAQISTAKAAKSVQVNLGGGVNHQAGPLINAAGGIGTLYSTSGSLNYEVDLFGKLKQNIDATTLDAEARAGLLQSTKLLVQSEVAQNYLNLRALDEERVLVRHTVEAYKNTLTLTEHRFASGSVAELDVVRAKSELASTQSELLVLDRRRAEMEHALAMLTGEVASTFHVTEAPWMSVIPNIPAGIPSSLLARRPDIATAQNSVLAAQARLGIAQKAWFPNVSLTGSSGFASPNLGKLFSMSMRAWGLGLLFSLPIFDGGRREAEAKIANAEVDAMITAHREKILLAFKEIEDQLSTLRILAEQALVQKQAVELSGRAAALSGSRYQNGLVSQLDVLDAQRTQFRNQRLALQIKSAQYQATVAMIRALGGGWDASMKQNN
jgi:outer membrane protein, multidrug efflux system